MIALLLFGTVQACVVTDSWLGYTAKPIPIHTQYVVGPSINLHIRLDRLAEPTPVIVEWFWKGKRVKVSTIKGTRVLHYSNISIKAKPGEWTVIAKNVFGSRSHHFVVR